MTLTRKDLAATLLTTLVVLAFAAAHEGWNVWLIGDSRRWAAGAITLLGAVTCALGRPARGRMTKVLALLSVAALAIVAIATASLTALSLLVADIVVLWALSTVRHGRPAWHRPLHA